MSVVSASLNIGQQSTKLFPKYSRYIDHLHKYDITPPEYIYVDIECQGTAGSPAQGVGHLIEMESRVNRMMWTQMFMTLFMLLKKAKW